MKLGCLRIWRINILVYLLQLYVVSSRPIVRRVSPGEFKVILSIAIICME